MKRQTPSQHLSPKYGPNLSVYDKRLRLGSSSKVLPVSHASKQAQLPHSIGEGSRTVQTSTIPVGRFQRSRFQRNANHMQIEEG